MFSFLRQKRAKQPVDVVVNTASDVFPYLYWADTRQVRFHLPPAMLCTQPALGYANGHPFVQALDSGAAALRRFYAGYQPTDLAAAYHLDRRWRLGEDLPPWEVPWMMLRARLPPKGEHGLDPAHGFALYGPVTEQKVALEMSRLESVATSIAKRGYDPTMDGGIQGQFLAKGDRLVFFVKGGKHRTAALVHSGRSHIPVTVRQTWAPVVNAADVQRWPLVLAGTIDPAVATEVMSAYLPEPAASDTGASLCAR